MGQYRYCPGDKESRLCIWQIADPYQIPGLRQCLGPVPGLKVMRRFNRLSKVREVPPQQRYVTHPELPRCAIKPLLCAE